MKVLKKIKKRMGLGRSMDATFNLRPDSCKKFRSRDGKNENRTEFFIMIRQLRFIFLFSTMHLGSHGNYAFPLHSPSSDSSSVLFAHLV
jgi:hypothetical protein